MRFRMSGTSADTSDAVRALKLSALIEKTTTVLPRPGRILLRRHQRPFFYDKNIAFSCDLEMADSVPCAGVFVNHLTGASLLNSRNHLQTSSYSTADVVMAGGMRSPGKFRFRSFYLTSTHARYGATTLATHQRVNPRTPSPLARGARVAATLHGQTPFVVPRVLEQGVSRKGFSNSCVVDWVVEAALDGASIAADEAEDTVRELIQLLEFSWLSLGVEHSELDSVQRTRALDAVAALVNDPPADIWPDDVDRTRTWRRVQNVLSEHRPLTVGLSHGDPGLGNLLRLVDGRLALIDWEDAAMRPVAHDAIKAMISAPDPAKILAMPPTVAEFRSAMAAAGAATWEVQLAIALLMFLSGWKHRHVRAVERRSRQANNRRMHRMIRFLDQLLDS